MGGFSFVYRKGLNADAEPTALAMIRCLYHRGDVWAICSEPDAALGAIAFRRELGHQPHASPIGCYDGRFIVCSDSRLTNKPSVIENLHSHGIIPENTTDSAVIAACLAIGESFPFQQLKGDFAFVGLDRSNSNFVCARSQNGMRPLLYSRFGTGWVFSSEARPILAIAGHEPTLNEEWASMWLTQGVGHWELSIFDGIRSILPGEYVLVKSGSIEKHTIESTSDTFYYNFTTQEEADTIFRKKFECAVDYCMNDETSPMFDLSGGFDSSSIVCTAADILRRRRQNSRIICFHIFSERFQDVDERIYVSEVQKAFPEVEVHYVNRDKYLAFDDAFHGQVWGNTPSIPSLIYPALRRQKWKIAEQWGLNVEITGVFGDRVLGGSTYYLNDYVRKSRLLDFIRERRTWRLIHGDEIADAVFKEGYAWQYLLFYFGIRPLLLPLKPILAPFHERSAVQRLVEEQQKKVPWIRRSLLEKSVFLNEKDGLFLESHYRDPLNRLLALMILRHADSVALQGEDVLASSLENREPYADSDLLEFIRRVRPQFKVRAGQTKFFGRSALTNIVPPKINHRFEKVLSARLFLQGVAKHRQRLMHLVEKMPEVLEPFIDRTELARAIHRAALGDDVFDPGLYGALAIVLWSHRLPWVNGDLPFLHPDWRCSGVTKHEDNSDQKAKV